MRTRPRSLSSVPAPPTSDRPASARLAAALLVLALSACGGKPDGETAGKEDTGGIPSVMAASDGPLPNACALIDANQVQTVLGQPAGMMGDDPENCVWASQGHPGNIAMFMVQLSEESSADEAQTMYDAMVGALGGSPGDDSGTLSGLGDRAWRTTGNVDAVRARAIVVRKGRRMLVLNLTGMRPDSGLDARLEQAARDAATRL
ncbi:MAG: hypothetical protein ACOY82_12610 [Pseudomonadota bacterium]